MQPKYALKFEERGEKTELMAVYDLGRGDGFTGVCIYPNSPACIKYMQVFVCQLYLNIPHVVEGARDLCVALL